jgi:hypothetical protein
MSCLVLYTDQMVKQKQYDLLREAEHYRLVKAIGQLRPNHLQEVVTALRKAMVGLTRSLPGFKPVEWKARS